MILQDIFSHLTLGELKQVSLGGYDTADKTITADNYCELVQHLNLGLMNLYVRFPVLEQEYQFTTEADKTLYPLPSDCIKVMSVWDQYGIELGLNDEHDPMGVYINNKHLQIPFATGFEDITVIYRSRIAAVDVPDNAQELDLTQNVDIPEYLLEPLLAYIEYRVHRSRGGESGTQLAMIAKQTYEALCGELEHRNLFNDSDLSTCIKPQLRGFV